MSFPQQSRSDVAAAEANLKRRQLDTETSRNQMPRDERDPVKDGVIARFRRWLRRTIGR